MDELVLSSLFQHMVGMGVSVEPGLSPLELHQIESRYDICFPEDLAQMLQFGLPVWKHFPDWRNGSEQTIRRMLQWPLEGICFDIEHANFWLEAWGERPVSLEERFEIARRLVSEAPRLIPVYGHRYIPAEPLEPGNPVFSVYQTDIIHYGVDLTDYFCNDFHFKYITSSPRQAKEIRFWSDLVS